MGARAGISTGATLYGPSVASWFLERKLGEGYRDTLDHSDVWIILMFLCNQAWISLLPLPEPVCQGQQEAVLKVKCFREASLVVQKDPLSAGEVPGKGCKRGCLIFADINGGISQLVSNG